MTKNGEKGIFAGTDLVIAEFFGVESRKNLDHKTVCKKLAKDAYSFSDGIGLASNIYKCIKRNWSGNCRSTKNWRLTPTLGIGENNTSPEVMLERALVQLSDNGHVNGWVNQIPVVSGLVEKNEEGRRAIDLLYLTKNTAEFVELKWASNTPVFAAMEILEYGMAYLFSRQHRSELGYTDNQLMTLGDVKLSVLAPAEYYFDYEVNWLALVIDQGLKAFSEEVTEGELSMQFEFQAFPSGFLLPFENGAQVNAQCNTKTSNATTEYLVNMLRNRVRIKDGC